MFNKVTTLIAWREESFEDQFNDWLNDVGPTLSKVLPICLIICVILAVAATVLGLCFGNKIRKEALGSNDLNSKSKTSDLVKVVEKFDPPQLGKTNAFGDYYAHIIFEKADGTRYNFAIADQNKYYNIIVNDVGTLIHAGRAFIDFERKIGE